MPGAGPKGTLAPSREEVAAALAGHLCRCGAAHPGAADQFGAGQTHILAQDVDKRGIDRIGKALAGRVPQRRKLIMLASSWTKRLNS
jgi:hypothetical protein